MPDFASGTRVAAAIRARIQAARRLGHEVGKFGVIGVIAWIVDTAVFNAFLSWEGNRYWAAVVSTTVSATVAFIGNRFWTWRDRPRSGLRREYLLYAVFNVVGLAIGLACLGISHEVLGAMWPSVFQTRLADNIAKQGVGLVLGTVFRFWSYRRFIFPEAPASAAAVMAADPEPVPADPRLLDPATAAPAVRDQPAAPARWDRGPSQAAPQHPLKRPAGTPAAPPHPLARPGGTHHHGPTHPASRRAAHLRSNGSTIDDPAPAAFDD